MWCLFCIVCGPARVGAGVHRPARRRHAEHGATRVHTRAGRQHHWRRGTHSATSTCQSIHNFPFMHSSASEHGGGSPATGIRGRPRPPPQARPCRRRRAVQPPTFPAPVWTPPRTPGRRIPRTQPCAGERRCVSRTADINVPWITYSPPLCISFRRE